MSGCVHRKILTEIPEFAPKKGKSNLISPVLCPDCNFYLVRKKTRIVLDSRKKKSEKKGSWRTLSLIKNLLSFLWKKKLWWLAPIILMLIVVGFMIFVGQSSALSPFVYALF